MKKKRRIIRNTKTKSTGGGEKEGGGVGGEGGGGEWKSPFCCRCYDFLFLGSDLNLEGGGGGRIKCQKKRQK